jgi:hypothetical protein
MIVKARFLKVKVLDSNTPMAFSFKEMALPQV